MDILKLIKRRGISDAEYQLVPQEECTYDPVLSEIIATELELNKAPKPQYIPFVLIVMFGILGAFFCVTFLFPWLTGNSSEGILLDFKDPAVFLCFLFLPLGLPLMFIGVNIIAFTKSKAKPRVFYFPAMSIATIAEILAEPATHKSKLTAEYHFLTVSKDVSTLGAYLIDCRRTHPGIFISASDVVEATNNLGGKY